MSNFRIIKIVTIANLLLLIGFVPTLFYAHAAGPGASGAKNVKSNIVTATPTVAPTASATPPQARAAPKNGAFTKPNNLPAIVEDTSGPYKQSSNELTKLDNKNDYIYLNTIDGFLYAVGKNDGKIKWSLKEDAVLKFPENYENPYFLTDPRDGSLYIFTNQKEGLKKFPYTIAELVSASPSKSSDGYLYTGDKKDQWLAIDYRNGYKLDTLTSETLSSKISISDENIIFIGRTQYTITMFDIATRRKIFNLTYYDYSTHAHASKSSATNLGPNRPLTQSANINADKGNMNTRSYPYYHFTSSSDGTLVTLDRKTGELIWELKLENPVIAMYRYENEQLFKINFAIFAVEALTNLNPNKFRLLYMEQKYQDQDGVNHSQQQKPSPNKVTPTSPNLFVSTLYIGFYKNNLYALPALIYNWQSPGITGPDLPSPGNLINAENDTNELIDAESSTTTDPSTSIISVGHHKLPDRFEPPPDYIQPNDKLIVISTNKRDEDNFVTNLNDLFGTFKQPSCPVDNPKGKQKGKSGFVSSVWRKFDDLMQNKYFWTIFTVLLGSLPPLIKTVYDYKRKRKDKMKRQQVESESTEESEDEMGADTQHKSSNSNRSRNSSKNSSLNGGVKNSSSKRSGTNDHNNHNGPPHMMHLSHSTPDINSDGTVKIGKISYDPSYKLGHGCSGTFVYKGTFENRPVAVKRLLPECYTLADREVDLLRDADQHPNVLRYFCTEADSQFRYIALELCQMTLNDYVHNQFNLTLPPKNELRILSILEQATNGLDHLHSLDIVHRDIKPQNILISFPDQKGRVFVMISDFGLCKRLEMGNNSFSKRSGILGTEGWIAPEVLDDIYGSIQEQFDNQQMMRRNSNGADNDQSDAQTSPKPKRITKAVDIFSMGCVYYFVLSGGSHPFGDHIMRQANILQNNYKLDKLSSVNNCETYMQRILIEKMITNEPKKRPTTKEILSYPVFWSKAKTLQFLQDVSDRIEKLDPTDPILVDLEKNANVIIRNNWRMHICLPLQNDLKKFRSYNGVCLRDLLRAIRNKKHHYRELPPDVMQSLGSLPDEFIDYFTVRFPKLIIHVYEVMKCCSHESMLDVYYNHKEHHL